MLHLSCVRHVRRPGLGIDRLRLNSKTVGGPDSGGADHPVPQLVACTLDNGMAAVFPGDPQTCARLGLPQLAE